MATHARYRVVTDLETTGLNPREHSIIQISRQIVDVVDQKVVPNTAFNRYIWPVRWGNRSEEAMGVNQITKEHLQAFGVPLSQALSEFSRGVNWANSVIAAWGNDFEMKFLASAYERLERPEPYTWKSFDVRSAANVPVMKARQEEYYGLVDAAKWLGLDVDESRVHDAMYDVELTCDVLLKILR